MTAELCSRCWHPADWHRLDDSTNVAPTDPAAEFRCLGYDCTAPGLLPPGGRGCTCPNMVHSGWRQAADSTVRSGSVPTPSDA